jgi:uncharacterized protein YqiB (DUF1249 family)
MLELHRITRAQSSGRFAWLMGLYAENYWRLVRSLGPDALPVGRYLSSVGDGLDLSVEMIERHPYTLEMRLSYLFEDETTGAPDPSAFVRVYQDAQVAEVTACYVGSRLQDVLGLHPEPRSVMQHRLRMNAFLGKWLDYLDGRGHSRFTLRPAAARDAAAVANQKDIDGPAPRP